MDQNENQSTQWSVVQIMWLLTPVILVQINMYPPIFPPTVTVIFCVLGC